jgi:hypothetical protein
MTMKTYLAIGTLSSGKSFRYSDSAISITAFAQFVETIYPTFEIDAIIFVEEVVDWGVVEGDAIAGNTRIEIEIKHVKTP